MYWPIGAPRVYAAKVPQPSISLEYDSEDAAEFSRHNRLSISSVPDDPEHPESTKGSIDDEDEGRKIGEQEVEDEESLPETPSAQSGRGPTRSTSNEESRTHIVALRVARSGMLFATVTRAELTIWQMKVGQMKNRKEGAIGRARSS